MKRALLIALAVALAVGATACGGDDEDEGAAGGTTTEPVQGAGLGSEEVGTADSTVLGRGASCGATTILVEFVESGVRITLEGGDELVSTASVREGAGLPQTCKDAGTREGAVEEPFKVANEPVTLRCTAQKPIDIVTRTAQFGTNRGNEISAGLQNSPIFFLKAHAEHGRGRTFLLYSEERCKPTG